MNRNDIPRIREHVTARTIGGEVFIMHLDTLKTYSLNATASFAWALFDSFRTTDEIVAAVMDEYDIGEAECRDSITEMLDILAAEGLISLVGPDA